MKKTIIMAAISAISLALAAKTSTPAGFTDDLDAALEASKKSGKTVYAVFSGSDWCYWCKVLEENYLSKKEFVDEASKSFELVFIDSPNNKKLLTEKAAKRNPELTKKYGIRGFPTVKFIAADGSATDASRPAKGVTPKAYAQSLANGIKYRPLIEKHVKPLENEIASVMMNLYRDGMKIGDPFAKKTEAEQRAAFNDINAMFKDIVGKLEGLREKIAKTDIPAEIVYEKENLLNKLDRDLKAMKKQKDLTFEEAKKLKDARSNRKGKRKLK